MKTTTKIQLLVDGQLDHHSRSKWLDSLDPCSDQWREIAIAFIEKQVMDEALSGLSEPVKVVKASNANSSNATSINPFPTKAQFSIAGICSIIAASLLTGLVGGSMLQDFTRSRLGSQPVVRVPAVPAADQQPPSRVVNHGEDVSVVASKTMRLEDALARSVRPVSLKDRRTLLKHGYFLDETKELADVELPSGELIQMPVRQFSIRFLGNAAFQ